METMAEPVADYCEFSTYPTEPVEYVNRVIAQDTFFFYLLKRVDL
jgi:hypothetical protein